MDIKISLEDVDSMLAQIEDEIEKAFETVGKEAVEYAKQHGSYRDVTGRLRRSNKYRASKEGLELFNDAPYAEAVEMRGYDVITGAALYAEKRLKEM